MRRVLHLAVHDTKLFLLERENFFFMFLMPVMFMLFFSVVLGDGGGPADVKISLQVVNEDQGFMGEIFLDQLRGEEFDITLLSQAEADTTDYIRRLVVPVDFTAKVLATEHTNASRTSFAQQKQTARNRGKRCSSCINWCVCLVANRAHE